VSHKENVEPHLYCQTTAKRIDKCGQLEAIVEYELHYNHVKDAY